MAEAKAQSISVIGTLNSIFNEAHHLVCAVKVLNLKGPIVTEKRSVQIINSWVCVSITFGLTSPVLNLLGNLFRILISRGKTNCHSFGFALITLSGIESQSHSCLLPKKRVFLSLINDVFICSTGSSQWIEHYSWKKAVTRLVCLVLLEVLLWNLNDWEHLSGQDYGQVYKQ